MTLPWLVVWECKCDRNAQGLDRAHYLIGPFSTREAAEEWAQTERDQGHEAVVPPTMRPW